MQCYDNQSTLRYNGNNSSSCQAKRVTQSLVNPISGIRGGTPVHVETKQEIKRTIRKRIPDHIESKTSKYGFSSMDDDAPRHAPMINAW